MKQYLGPENEAVYKTRCGSKLGPGHRCGSILDTVWVQTWTRCGSILDMVWVHPGHDVGPTWTRCGSKLGHSVDPTWTLWVQLWTRCGSKLDPVWVHPGPSLGPGDPEADPDPDPPDELSRPNQGPPPIAPRKKMRRSGDPRCDFHVFCA